MRRTILVTGGAGYIGTHACIELAAAGFDLVVMDNLSNSKREAVRRTEQIIGRSLQFYTLDLRDAEGLSELFRDHAIDAVVHFAGLKAVAESVTNPLGYYDNNLSGSLVLLEQMELAGVRNIVFSSSATVYGDPAAVPIHEKFPLSVTNPYGRTKLVVEQILGDLFRADDRWRIGILRYFNPAGAHISGLIGEDPNGIPNNLMPILTQIAVGRRSELLVFGNDYSTPDGTGVRDYIHVVDLAAGHVAAMNRLLETPGMFTVNLGTGRGYTVLEVIGAFEKACGQRIAHRMAGRRDGDVAQCFADPKLAATLLGWSANRSLDQMCQDSWRWQTMNPLGYET